jgi:hypothetical protein
MSAVEDVGLMIPTRFWINEKAGLFGKVTYRIRAESGTRVCYAEWRQPTLSVFARKEDPPTFRLDEASDDCFLVVNGPADGCWLFRERGGWLGRLNLGGKRWWVEDPNRRAIAFADERFGLLGALAAVLGHARYDISVESPIGRRNIGFFQHRLGRGDVVDLSGVSSSPLHSVLGLCLALVIGLHMLRNLPPPASISDGA